MPQTSAPTRIASCSTSRGHGLSSLCVVAQVPSGDLRRSTEILTVLTLPRGTQALDRLKQALIQLVRHPPYPPARRPTSGPPSPEFGSDVAGNRSLTRASRRAKLLRRGSITDTRRLFPVGRIREMGESTPGSDLRRFSLAFRWDARGSLTCWGGSHRCRGRSRIDRSPAPRRRTTDRTRQRSLGTPGGRPLAEDQRLVRHFRSRRTRLVTVVDVG